MKELVVVDQKTFDHLRCVVERIAYQSDGYSALKCAAKGYNDLIAVVCMMPDTHVGSVLTVGGYWKIDSKYGRQFEVVTFEESLTATVYGIEKYLVKMLSTIFTRHEKWRAEQNEQAASKQSET